MYGTSEMFPILVQRTVNDSMLFDGFKIKELPSKSFE